MRYSQETSSVDLHVSCFSLVPPTKEISVLQIDHSWFHFLVIICTKFNHIENIHQSDCGSSADWLYVWAYMYSSYSTCSHKAQCILLDFQFWVLHQKYFLQDATTYASETGRSWLYSVPLGKQDRNWRQANTTSMSFPVYDWCHVGLYYWQC